MCRSFIPRVCALIWRGLGVGLCSGGLLLTLWAFSARADEGFTVAYNEATAGLVPVMKAAYADIGMQPVFVMVPSERALAQTDKGYYDADLSRVISVLSDYPNLVHLNEPIKQTELYPYVRAQSLIVIHRASELQFRTVGFVRGSKLAEGFVRSEGLESVVVNNAAALHAMLAAGRFDVALISSTQLGSQSGVITAGAVRAGPSLRSEMSVHVLHRRHADLIPRLDAALKAMRKDGRLAALLASPG